MVDAVYDHETFHPLTPLRGLKDQDRVRLQIWTLDETKNASQGLADLLGGWAGSEELAAAVEKIHRSRSAVRELPGQ